MLEIVDRISLYAEVPQYRIAEWLGLNQSTLSRLIKREGSRPKANERKVKRNLMLLEKLFTDLRVDKRKLKRRLDGLGLSGVEVLVVLVGLSYETDITDPELIRLGINGTNKELKELLFCEEI